MTQCVKTFFNKVLFFLGFLACGCQNVEKMNLRSLTGSSSNGGSSSSSASSPLRIDLWLGQLASIGFSDGVADAAHFYNPTGITLLAGFAYVSDSDNCLIRKIDLATNTVTTLAGSKQDCRHQDSTDSTGATARFFHQKGITNDGTDLYVADFESHTIRRVNTTSGNTTTIAGTPNVQGVSAPGPILFGATFFSYPYAIVYVPAQNALFVSEEGNFVIRRLNFGSGQVFVWAGTQGSAGTAFGGPGTGQIDQVQGLTFDTTNIYFTDRAQHTVRSAPIATGAIVPQAGIAGSPGFGDGAPGAATFDSPTGIAVNLAGDLIIADTGNHTLRRLSLGAVTTIAGGISVAAFADGSGAAARFNTPTDIVFDGVSTFYIADSMNNTIRSLDGLGNVTRIAGQEDRQGSANGAGTTARVSDPWGMAYDGSQFVYFADTNNHVIRRIDVATQTVTTFAGTVGTASYNDGTAAAALFNTPFGVAICSGKIFVTEQTTHRVRQIVITTGIVSTLAGDTTVPAGTIGNSNNILGTNARFHTPLGITCNQSGTKLYVADRDNARVREINISTTQVTTVAGAVGAGYSDGTLATSRMSNPTSVTMANDNVIYVADPGNEALREINLTFSTLTTLAGDPPPGSSSGNLDGIGTAALLGEPVSVLTNGTDVYILDRDPGNAGNSNFKQYNIATGQVTTLAGTPSGTTPGILGDVDGLLSAAFFALPNAMVYVNGTGLLISNPSGIRLVH